MYNKGCMGESSSRYKLAQQAPGFQGPHEEYVNIQRSPFSRLDYRLGFKLAWARLWADQKF